MTPPKALRGFYFDPDKNRYFPIKGPIPGSKRASASSYAHDSLGNEPNKKLRVPTACRKKQGNASVLLRNRELHGKLFVSNKRRCNFEHEYQKLQASCPMVWKYPSTSFITDSALEQLYGNVQTNRGLERTDLLTVGSMKGSLRLYEVGNVEQSSTYGFKSTPLHSWPPVIKSEAGCYSSLGSIWSSAESCATFSSSISHIQRIGKHSLDPADDVSLLQNALVTTLGSGMCGGTVNMLNVSEPLDFNSGAPCIHRRTSRLVSCDCTIWTADCNPNGTKAVIGTNMGAALIDLETGNLSWVYRTKSDIFSQQHDRTGNVVLCGLRNGSIVAVDVRQKLPVYYTPSARRHVPSIIPHKRPTRQKLQVWRNLNCLGDVSMSSAVCSLIKLESDDQYFLGSSMDGSIKLFDQRLLDRGAVQSYEGHVNTHTQLKLAVNPSETLVMSGGEDCFMRIWSVKSGELLFEENVTDSVIKTICWPCIGRGIHGSTSRYYDKKLHEPAQSWGAWMGSCEGLYYIHGT